MDRLSGPSSRVSVNASCSALQTMPFQRCTLTADAGALSADMSAIVGEIRSQDWEEEQLQIELNAERESPRAGLAYQSLYRIVSSASVVCFDSSSAWDQLMAQRR